MYFGPDGECRGIPIFARKLALTALVLGKQ